MMRAFGEEYFGTNVVRVSDLAVARGAWAGHRLMFLCKLAGKRSGANLP